MNRKTIFGIMMALLLASMFAWAFKVQPVKGSGTIYIRADGSIEPSTANITSLDNITYTFTGNILDNSICVERNNIVVDGKGYTLQGTGIGLDLSYRSNVTVKNMEIGAFYYGICLDESSKNTISGNDVSAEHGIILFESSNNTLTGNGLTTNLVSITIGDSSNYNSINGNHIINNNPHSIMIIRSSYNTIYENKIEHNDEAIHLHVSSNNTIYGNKIEHNYNGIVIENNCHNNTVSGNTITNNNFGFYLLESSNNTLTGNTITNNYLGIYVGESSNNRFFHNDFISNINQAYDDSPWNNNWHNPTLLEGNYWSDYEGVDDGSGVGKHAISGDGIGDTLIPHPDEDYDFYPLMEPWTPIPPTINATVDVIPSTLNLRSKPKYVTAFIELPEGYNMSDIAVSTILMNNTIPIDPDAPVAVGDYDDDTIPDLMVKFNGKEVIEYILDNINLTRLVEKKLMDVTLTIAGKLYDGVAFEGSDIIRIMMPGSEKFWKFLETLKLLRLT